MVKIPKIPWNILFATLNQWMNEVNIDPAETLEAFIKKYEDLQTKMGREVEVKLTRAFSSLLSSEPDQGFDQRVIPVNFILSDEKHRDTLSKASLGAGLYPVLVDQIRFAEHYLQIAREARNARKQERGMISNEFNFVYWWSGLESVLTENVPVVITQDMNAISNIKIENSDASYIVDRAVSQLRKNNPIFSFIEVNVDEEGEPEKKTHGNYLCTYNEEQYRGLLKKLKADLLLTMLLRGGAPIVK